MKASYKARDKSHARIYAHWETLPAWYTLSVYARAILTELLKDYRAGKNFLLLSDAAAARRANCCRSRAAKAIGELLEKGWIGIARMGRIHGPKAKRCSAYYLTMYPEEIGLPATHAYRNWRPLQTA